MSDAKTAPQNRIRTDYTIKDMLDLYFDNAMMDFNCHALATIQSFDPAKQTVTATINYKKTEFEANANGVYSKVLVDYPILLDCPAIVLSGGNACLTMPIAKGDTCVILFNDRDIDNWFQSGQSTALQTSRLHSLADGIALVGLRSLKNSIQDYDPDRAVLRNGTTKIGVGADKITIANQLYNLNTLLQQLLTQLQSMTMTGVTPGSGVSGPPSNAAAIANIATQIGALLE